MKRQLNSDEKRMTLKTLKAKKDDMAWINYQVKYYKLMLDDGLEQNYLKQRRDYAKMLKELESERDINLNIDKEMRRQLKEGVEILEKMEKEVEKNE